MKRLVGLLVLVLMSCNKDVVSSNFKKDFDNNRWLLNQRVDFDIEVANNEDLWFHFSHVYGDVFKEISVDVTVTEKSSGNEIAHSEEIILLKDENGKDLGDCVGDVCDIYQKINIPNLEKGTYKLSFKNTKSAPYLPNVLGVGYLLKKKKN